MELEQIRIFCAVAGCRSFSRAAQELYVSHSTTCRAVAALEAELGVRLLARSRRAVALTPAGELLLHEGRTLLCQADMLSARLRAMGEKLPEGEIKPGKE